MTHPLPRSARALRRAIARTLTAALLATLALVGVVPGATAADVGPGGATPEEAVPLPGAFDAPFEATLSGSDVSQWYVVTATRTQLALQVEVLDGPAPWVEIRRRSDFTLVADVGGSWFHSALFDAHAWVTPGEEYLIAFYREDTATTSTVRATFGTVVPDVWVSYDPATLEVQLWAALADPDALGSPVTSITIWCIDRSSIMWDPVRCGTIEPNYEEGWFGGVVDVVRGRELALAVSMSNGVVESARSAPSYSYRMEAPGEAAITTEPAAPVAGEPFDLVVTPTADGVARPDMYPVLSVDGVQLPNPVQVGDRWVFRGLTADAGTRVVTGVVHGGWLTRSVTVDGVEIEVARASQTFTFGALAATPYYGGPGVTLEVTASSGLPVALEASGACTLTGGELAFTGVGQCSVVATQEGDANHLPHSSLWQVDVARRPQSLTVAPLPALVFGQAPVALEASSSEALPVVFTAEGACAVDGSELTVVGAGDCTVTVSQAGDALTAPANATVHAVVDKRSQPVSLVLGSPAAGTVAVPVTATSPYGLPVTVTATGACELTDGVLRGVGEGECVVVADAEGDDVSEPGRAEATRTAQSVVLDPIGPDRVYGGAQVALSATASSGLPVSFAAQGACEVAGGEVSFTGAGTCEVVAWQGGDGTYLPAGAQVVAEVQPRSQVLTVEPLPALVYGQGPVELVGSSDVGLPVVFTAEGACEVRDGVLVTVGAGECTVTAHQVGDAVTAPATAQVGTVVAKRAHEVSLTVLTSGAELGGEPVPVVVTSEHGLAVTVTASGSCLLADGMVRGVGSGECVLVAHAAGDAVTEPGSAVARLWAAGVSSTVRPTIDGRLGDAAAGAPVQATGTGLLPGSELVLEVRSTPQVIGSAVVGPDGTATVTASLPDALTPGDHHLVALGTALDGSARQDMVPFTVAEDGVIVRIEDRELEPELPEPELPEPELPEPELPEPELPGPVLWTFPDVPGDHPFHADIEWLVERGITTGYEDGTFRPSRGVSRQAMAAFVARWAGADLADVPREPVFTDVGRGHPFFAEIQWMAAAGLAEGYDDGTFRGGRGVSRQAMAAFLHRAAGSPAPSAPAAFVDVPAEHPFAASISWLAEVEVTTGHEDGTFRPGKRISRQAMAAFLHRFDQLD